MRSRRRNRWVVSIIVLAVIGIGIGLVLAQTATPPVNQTAANSDLSNTREVQVNDAGLRYIVDPDLLIAGGPPEDGIPSIDHPVYVSVQEANEWIADNELVLALVYKGITRVYPLQILVWHEIVNDTVAGDPLLITYCPLCGSGIAYDRTIEGQPVEFGTSGNLYNSNLVMYDRQTKTYWSQIDGLAIVGERSGQELLSICLDTVVWGEWKIVHPEAEVLSQDTGFDRDYGTDPYGSYYEDSYVWFPVEGRDDRIHPKTVVFGIEVNGVHAAYREQDLIARGSIQDRVNGIRIRITRDAAGRVSVTNLATQETITKERGFWFAWVAFHPGTNLYLPSN